MLILDFIGSDRGARNLTTSSHDNTFYLRQPSSEPFRWLNSQNKNYYWRNFIAPSYFFLMQVQYDKSNLKSLYKNTIKNCKKKKWKGLKLTV